MGIFKKTGHQIMCTIFNCSRTKSTSSWLDMQSLRGAKEMVSSNCQSLQGIRKSFNAIIHSSRGHGQNLGVVSPTSSTLPSLFSTYLVYLVAKFNDVQYDVAKFMNYDFYSLPLPEKQKCKFNLRENKVLLN